MDTLEEEAEGLFRLLDVVKSNHSLIVRGLLNRIKHLGMLHSNLSSKYEELQKYYDELRVHHNKHCTCKGIY
jgi:hypothetical protein